MWLAQGTIDCQLRNVDAGAYTFFKENEAKGDYRVLNWPAASTYTYYPNLNCSDAVLADLFAKPEFRQALNLAINREEIAQVVYGGLCTPRHYSPVTVHPSTTRGWNRRGRCTTPRRPISLSWRRAWTDIGVKTSVKGLDRSLYTEHHHNGDIEVGYWSWDRASANRADPGRWSAKTAPMIAKNNFRNVKGGYLQDDTLRDYGLLDPPTFI